MNDDWIVQVPPNIAGWQELFDILAQNLDFLDYFGRNWDTLYDLLCDLSWIQQRQIVMIHNDLPVLLGEKDVRKYLLSIKRNRDESL